MGALVLKSASGVAATCGLAACKAMLWIFTLWLWLAILLTAIWPFVAVYVLAFGTDEMIRDIPPNAVCWAFNAAGILFIAWSSRAER